MNKESLKEYLGSRYQGWSSFLNNVIFPIFGEDDFEDGFEAELLDSQPERRQLAVATGICSIKQVGKMYVGVEPLQIFDVTVSDRVKMERNRVNIQRLIRSVMDQYSCAFMLFHYEDDTRWDWRFTYCRKSGNKEETTDSKRYTFLLGPGQSCRTATDNFMALYEKRNALEIKDIENAFNVEALSKEFFGKYKTQYEAFVNYMVDPANDMRQNFIDTDFDHTGMTAVRIREREEKPIRDYVKKLLGRIVFLHFLQKKGWLGVPVGKDWGEGDRDFMLHLFQQASEKQKENFLDDILEDLFAEGLDCNRSEKGDLYDTKVEGFRNCRIPYLNGGLFERDSLDQKPCHFPADYFNELLTMLSQYNFTIDENDPNDAEVGVDPEMLGRIFENLLEDNKDKGAFYTPKEIVQYMCRESLIAYLQTDQTEENKELIRQFVMKHDAELLGNLKNDIDKKLRDVKICDPAIGSGAFPMGLLRELFFCRSAIEANNVENAAKIKLQIIQNNIYGVDIEQGAVEIARLRFWLSIIVDEPSPTTLPNLDYKIMRGNSLLTTFCERYVNLDTKSQHHEKVAEMNKEKRNLYTFMQQHYTATGDQKLQLNVEIKKSILRLIAHQLGVESRSWFKNNVEQLDVFNSQPVSFNRVRTQLPAEQQQAIDKCEELYKTLCNNNLPLAERSQTDIQFFDWRMMFTEVFDANLSQKTKDGFDIVIGNPPYVVVNKRDFPQYKWNTDLYKMFYEVGITKLMSKNGCLCYITPKFWMLNLEDEAMRQYFEEKLRIYFISLCNPFESVVTENTIVLFSQANCRQTEIDMYRYNEKKVFQRILPLNLSYCSSNLHKEWVIGMDKSLVSLLTKMSSQVKLKNISSSKRGAEISKKELRNTERGIPSLIGQDMKRYSISWANTYMDLNHKEYRRLVSFFRSNMIYLRRVDVCLEATVSEKTYAFNKNVYGIIIDEGKGYMTKYVLALLNSKALNFYYKKRFSTKKEDVFPEIQTYLYEQLPIPFANKEQQRVIVDLVDKILAMKKTNADIDTSMLEDKLDQCVYALFHFSDDEIKIVEGN